MKVCHLTSVHPANDTRIFIKECKSLANEGFEVHFIVPGISDSIDENVHLHGIKKINRNRFTRMTKTVNSVYKKAISINADIYHFHDPELLYIGLKLKKSGKIVIYDIHEDLPRALLSKKWINPIFRKVISTFFELFENKLSRKFDYLFPATPYITERFKKINLNTVNINNYPLLNELQNLNKTEVTNKKNQVCYVGVLGTARGSNQILEAASLINGTICIAGKINSHQIKEQIMGHESIKYLGSLDRTGVKKLLSQSVAGIVTFLPEPNHINAQPNKMFEYMSAGIPVICSNFSLWRSIIEKHDCGICVDPKDPEAIANAINFLIENPEIAEEMGRNGRKAIETEYNWEQESVKLIDTYKKCIKYG